MALWPAVRTYGAHLQMDVDVDDNDDDERSGPARPCFGGY